MVADTQPKSLTDDFEHLFDLIKEGASYLLHIYLFFMSKTFSADSIEQILDHHRKTSSYDYSKEGKTYIFRLLSALFQVEKHIVAMNLQYMYNYIPFPFLKNISENFCITNNLKCTDLKKKTSKKVLIDNPDNETAVQNETKNSNEDDEPVSRPFPLAPPTPKSQTENTVSDPLYIISNSEVHSKNLQLQKTHAKVKFEEQSPFPTAPTVISSNTRAQILDTSLKKLDAKSSLTDTSSILSKSHRKPTESTTVANILLSNKSGPSSLKTDLDHIQSGLNNNKISVPYSENLITQTDSKKSVPLLPSENLSKNNKKSSHIPIKISDNRVESISSGPLKNPSEKLPSLKSVDSDNLSVSISPSNHSHTSPVPVEPGTSRDNESSHSLEKTSLLSFESPLNSNSPEGSDVKKTSRSKGILASTPTKSYSSKPPSTSDEDEIEIKSGPAQDMTNIFNPPSNRKIPNGDMWFSNPFTASTTSTEVSATSSHPVQTFPFPFPSKPETESALPNTVPTILQLHNMKATNKNAESVAPVSKKIPPSIDFGTSLQQTIEKNNKAFDKNMQNFGKSMTNVFEGTNTPTPGPSADE